MMQCLLANPSTSIKCNQPVNAVQYKVINKCTLHFMFITFINVSMLFILLTFQCSIHTYKNILIIIQIRHINALLCTINRISKCFRNQQCIEKDFYVEIFTQIYENAVFDIIIAINLFLNYLNCNSLYLLNQCPHVRLSFCQICLSGPT